MNFVAALPAVIVRVRATILSRIPYPVLKLIHFPLYLHCVRKPSLAKIARPARTPCRKSALLRHCAPTAYTVSITSLQHALKVAKQQGYLRFGPGQWHVSALEARFWIFWARLWWSLYHRDGVDIKGAICNAIFSWCQMVPEAQAGPLRSYKPPMVQSLTGGRESFCRPHGTSIQIGLYH